MEKASMFLGHSEFMTAIWYILLPLGNLVAYRWIFWYNVSIKIWQQKLSNKNF
jgi:hypothetical protein